MKETHLKRLLHCLQRWSSETIYFHANEYFEALIDELDGARHSIEFECYIFDQDPLGRRIIQHLKKAAKRGVEVRLIIDGYGSLEWNGMQVKELRDSGINVKVFHPLPWRLSLYHGTKVIKGFLARTLYLFSRINKRDHRKLYIIDNKSAWSGSMNISESHLNHSSSKNNWFDCGIRVAGIPITGLSASFDEVWRGKGLFGIGKKRMPFRTNNNPIRRQRKNFELFHLIRSATNRIWIISAYLAPSTHLIHALKKARKKNIEVKLFISQRSDVIFFPLVSTVYFKELLSVGVEIFEYKEKIIHAKAILMDNIALVGSSNLNHRSFLHDLELDIFLTTDFSLQVLEEQFKNLVANSVQIVTPTLSRLPWYKQLLGKLLWRMRYWL